MGEVTDEALEVVQGLVGYAKAFELAHEGNREPFENHDDQICLPESQ